MYPGYFIAHGAPTIIYDQNAYITALNNLKRNLPAPKGIIIFSAHYENQIQQISTAKRYSMIYDFYGFPEKLYDEQYPAIGDPKTAMRIHNMLKSSGINSETDDQRGLDHGAWTLLKMLFPKADIPIISMSVSPFSDPEELMKIGKALRTFREEGFLIIGSGGIVHNLGKVRLDDESTIDSWATEFNEWITKTLLNQSSEDLKMYREKAPGVDIAVERPEHFVPLLYLYGSKTNHIAPKNISTFYQYGNLSLDIWELM